jgi:RND superfamily putative drug exporter
MLESPDDIVVIGRDDDCDLVLHDEKVSRRHASLAQLPDGGVIATDLGSSNGTLVAGGRIEGPVELTGDTLLRLGDTVIAVEVRLGRTRLAHRGISLRVESGALHGRLVEVVGHDFVVGRVPGADLELPDPTVSARHASLSVVDEASAVITDLDSRNGTFVNGRQIYEPVLLEGGERVRFGDTVVCVRAAARRRGTLVSEIGAWLTIDTGPASGATTKATGPRFVIGRDEAADLTISDDNVSRRHAALEVTGPGCAVLTDLGSTNGTFVDGVRVDGPIELLGGERIRVGDTEIRFGEGPAEPPAAARAAPSTAIRSAALRPPAKLSTADLARACARRPWLTTALWTAAFLLGGAFAAVGLQDSLTGEITAGGNPESKRADALVEERLGGPRLLTELVVARAAGPTVDDPAFRREVELLQKRIVALGPDVVTKATSYYDARDPTLLADDERGVLLPVVLTGDFDHAEANVAQLISVVEAAGESERLDAFTTGEASIAHDFAQVAEHDLRSGESIGLAVAFVVLVFVFGAIAASLLPVAMAFVAIGVALGLATVIGQFTSLSIFVTNMIVGMGLALGIDYSLFVFTRYREERDAGKTIHRSIEIAGATSSRAVLFSGLAVVLALTGMVLTPDPMLRSLGMGAIVVGLMSVLAALTLLPAWLAILGDRVNRLSLRSRTVGEGATGREQRLWRTAANTVMSRPIVSLVLAVGVLVTAAVPVRDLERGTAGVSTLPDSAHSKQGFLAVQEHFPAALSDPVQVVVDGEVRSPPVRTAIEQLQRRLRGGALTGTPQLETSPNDDLAVLTAPISGDPRSKEAAATVERIRTEDIPATFTGVPAEALVTGTTARDADWVNQLSRALPFVLVFVLGLSFVLLTVAFGSIVVPAKAVLMNLLSVGAAYGLLVLVFQKGIGADLLGLQQVDRIEPWVPIFLFAILFGLSMDYHVFLLSRIRERFNETGDNRGAVAYGITSTARIITGAALIMVAVFAGFALGDLVPFQQLGFGMGVALLLDATVVRSVLVPAGMSLLGARNWYLPRWLRWLPELSVEGPGQAPPEPAERSATSEPALP